MTVTSSSDTATHAPGRGHRPATAPMWLRVAEYAVDNATPGGVVLLEPGELVRNLAARSTSEVSRGIRRAIATGWLDPRSSTRTLLVMPAKRRNRGAR